MGDADYVKCTYAAVERYIEVLEAGSGLHMVTGASTLCTLLSSTNTSKAFSQSTFTSFSASGSHFFSCSIH